MSGAVAEEIDTAAVLDLPCPKCGAECRGRVALKDHLVGEHQASAIDAWIAARQVEVGRRSCASIPVPPSPRRSPHR